MNFRIFVPIAGFLSLLGCTATFHLYPVKGPITGRSPIPIIEGHIKGPWAGRVSLTLPNGEVCEGKWNAGIAIIPDKVPLFTPGIEGLNLPKLWDEIFGDGYYIAKVVGERNHGNASLRGSKGTTIVIDFIHDLPGLPAAGVAQDDRGNIYKITL